MADSFSPAREVADVAQRLLGSVDELYRHRDVAITYLFNDREPADGEEPTHETIGKAVKASSVWQAITEQDFVIWVLRAAWERLDPAAREALVLHELLHIEVDDDGQVKAAKHDLEEFHLVARRYGAWDEQIGVFRKQLELFGEGGAA